VHKKKSKQKILALKKHILIRRGLINFDSNQKRKKCTRRKHSLCTKRDGRSCTRRKKIKKGP
jgi:hypothetical protein